MCDCSSCKYTDGFREDGFAKWPRGNPAGKKASSDYAAHVAYSKRGGIARAIPNINLDPIAFYGVPNGMTRSQVLDTLRRSFATLCND